LVIDSHSIRKLKKKYLMWRSCVFICLSVAYFEHPNCWTDFVRIHYGRLIAESIFSFSVFCSLDWQWIPLYL